MKDKVLEWIKIDDFKSQMQQFQEANLDDGRFKMFKENIYPCLDDNTQQTYFDPHYIYHPAWAARVVKQIFQSENAPLFHVDIASTLTFSTMLSAFIPVKFYDIRPAIITLSDLDSESMDLTSMTFESGSIKSLSCMHTIEHVGLGRYGDAIDPKGDLKAIDELKRVVAPGGNLLIVVPIGHTKLMFNAHRIYAYDQILSYFQDQFNLREFSLVTDDCKFITNATSEQAFQQQYGCGCFWFVKK